MLLALSAALLALTVVAIGVDLLAPGAAVDPAGSLHLVSSAAFGLLVSAVAARRANGRVRAVRSWIALAYGVWLAARLAGAVGPAGSGVGALSEVLLAGIVIAAAGAYLSNLRGLVGLREGIGICLDGLLVAGAVTVVLVALLGERAATEPAALSLLLHAIVFAGILGATLLLDLAVLAELAPRGAYLLLAGLALTAAGFLGRVAAQDLPPERPFTAIVSIGVVVVALGTATWTDRRDDRARYAAFASRLRDLLPLVAIGLAPIVLVAWTWRGPSVPAVTAGLHLSVAAVLAVAVVRQAMHLIDRGAVPTGLRAALHASRRRERQLAGLHEAGRILSVGGGTPQTLDRVAELLADQFGYTDVAIHQVEDGVTRLVARGSSGPPAAGDPAPEVSAIVERVARSRRLVCDPALDGSRPHPGWRGRAICAPLLDGDRLLGVLAVRGAEGRLDDLDVAAVTSVAAQLASTIARALEHEELAREQHFSSAVLAAIGGPLIVVDEHGRAVRFNEACTRLSGYSRAELERRGSLDFLVPADQRAAVRRAVREGLASFENDWVARDGTRHRILWTNTAVRDPDGRVRYTIASGIDISARKALEERLAHQALHDPLTGLANRALFMDRLEHAFRVRRQRAIGLLFIDVDDFKLVNDRFGHAAGDTVLATLARRLEQAIRAGDTAGRMGGDEFAILLEELGEPREATEVANRIRATLGEPIPVEGTSITVATSIGIATSPPDADDAAGLLRSADLAMYGAKRAAGRRSGGPVSTAGAVRERDGLRSALARAIDRGELAVFGQPIVDLAAGSVVGVEALVRWRHPERGLLLPAAFLDLAEESGLARDLGRYVLEVACRQAARAPADPRSDGPLERPAAFRPVSGDRADGGRPWVSVNVSSGQLADRRFVSLVAAALEKSGLEPARLVLEIVESSLVADTKTMNGRLRQLKELGVRLAVDDFGTGYSALGYLHRLPVDILKVDRSFIAGLGRPGRQDVFVGAIAALAERLGVDAVAEGIETPAQRARLLELGWRLGQGYLLGRPEPIEERDPDGRADRTPRSPAAAPATRRRASLADGRDRPGASTGAGAASAR